jgi:hypothetical protein
MARLTAGHPSCLRHCFRTGIACVWGQARDISRGADKHVGAAARYVDTAQPESFSFCPRLPRKGVPRAAADMLHPHSFTVSAGSKRAANV